MDIPQGLTGNAITLWNDTSTKFELETHELLTLEQACHELSLIERIQRDIDALPDLMETGSQGQRVVTGLVSEVRQHRAEFKSLIKALNLPSEDGMTTRSTQARAAANARWRRPA